MEILVLESADIIPMYDGDVTYCLRQSRNQPLLFVLVCIGYETQYSEIMM